jgi:mono/diheme cytochrome c family protein
MSLSDRFIGMEPRQCSRIEYIGETEQMGRFLVGILLGLVLAPAIVMLWLRVGKLPVAVADPPFFREEEITSVPLNARIAREAPSTAPITASETNLAAGAQIYREQCATCHGLHGKPVPFASHMFPLAPDLWDQHGDKGVVGVSDDPVGETYWKVSNGIRLTGMPAFAGILTSNQMWQVSLLLANADKPLPPAVVDLVRGSKTAAALPAKSSTPGPAPASDPDSPPGPIGK